MTITAKQAEYILQPHAISRSIYRMSATARKLIAMAMALIPSDFSCRTAEFSIPEFLAALDLDRGGNQYKLIQDAVRECIHTEIIIETGKKHWKMFTWISSAECSEDKITIKFSEELALYLLELKKMYAKIDLKEIGKLQSFYAYRYFEIAKSYESLSGKDGNKKGQWYFQKTIPEIRQIMGVKPEEYTLTKDLRKRVIEEPIKELNSNSATLGFLVELEYIRQGKYLASVQFLCTSNRPALPAPPPKRRRGRPRKANTAAAAAEPNEEIMRERIDRIHADHSQEFEAKIEFYKQNPDQLQNKINAKLPENLKNPEAQKAFPLLVHWATQDIIATEVEKEMIKNE